MRKNSIALWFFLVLSSPIIASTGAGNGGDVLDRFLEATRTSLIEVMGFIKQGVSEDSICKCDADLPPDVYCQELKGLTKEQVGFCREFVLATADQFLTLNKQQPITRFRLTERELFVNEPGGEKRPVSAMTNLGPEGDILFNYDRVEQLSPMGILSLIAHEFGHKSLFSGKYVSDNEAIGPFNFPGGGRHLMDSVGAAIATYAANHGKIGKYFTLEDRFSCHVEIDSGHGFGSKGGSPRVFAVQEGSYKAYRTGIGNSPRDFQCFITENFGASRLALQLTVHEEKGCEPVADEMKRWTKLVLIREQGDADSRTRNNLSVQEMKGFNPLCEDPSDKPLEITYDEGQRRYRFSVRYLGSVGKTNGYVRNRN